MQDTKLSAGDDALDVDTAKKVGEVFELDATAGRLVLRRPRPSRRARAGSDRAGR